MAHERLWELIDKVEKSGITVQREHHGGGRTQIRLLGPFWEVLLDKWYTTGATDLQCDEMESVLTQYLGDSK